MDHTPYAQTDSTEPYTHQQTQSLQTLEPAEATTMYLDSRRSELADRTFELQTKHVTSFAQWCQNNDIHSMNDVTARHVYDYRMEIAKEYAQSTVAIYISTIRQFVAFCESLNAVARGVSEQIVLPDRDVTARTEMLESDRAQNILSHLHRYYYGSRSHALFALMWHTGIRVGTVRALDVGDLQKENERLRIRHRPETGTPLKNKDSAERFVTLTGDVTDILDAYIDEHRHHVTDEHGRHPLITTENGRACKNTLRRNIYAVTRPCHMGQPCPHNREKSECNAAGATRTASECPSTVSCHPVRRGAITHWLRQDVPERIVSDRMNVTEDVLDIHYDRRSASEKAEQRRKFLQNI